MEPIEKRIESVVDTILADYRIRPQMTLLPPGGWQWLLTG